jgi:DNA end-binding protein Ku
LAETELQTAAVARAIWSGTITFGLVSIPVDLFAGERPRETSMKMVDTKGQPLGRRYVCPKDGKALQKDELSRGFETKSGKLVVVTDAELEAIAPEKSRDIDLRQFVQADQIPRAFVDRPYFLLPAGRSTKAYHLLAQTMEASGRAGIATFVMREKEYLVAILAERGVLRAETLRFAEELRAPDDVGIPAPGKPAPGRVRKFASAIDALARDDLDERELSDSYAQDLRDLAEKKRKKGQDVIAMPEGTEGDEGEPGADVIDLVKILKERLARNASVIGAAPVKGDRTSRATARRKSTSSRGARRKPGSPARRAA